MIATNRNSQRALTKANQARPAELMHLLMQLDPVDQLEMLQFIFMLREAKQRAMKPFSAREWERLTKWQKKLILFSVYYHLYTQRLSRYLRSLKPIGAMIDLFPWKR